MDTQISDYRYYDTEQNDTLQNDTQHKGINRMHRELRYSV